MRDRALAPALAAALVCLAGHAAALHASTDPAPEPPPPGWLTEKTERGVRLSATSAEPLTSRDVDSLKPVTVRPALRLECMEGKRRVLLLTALELAGSRPNEAQRLRLRFDEEGVVEWLASGLSERGKLRPTTLVLDERGHELVERLVLHDHLLVRFASRAGLEQASFDLDGLGAVLEPIAASCGLPAAFVKEAVAAHVRSTPAPAAAG